MQQSEPWKVKPVTATEWADYFIWVDRILLKINADERNEYRKLLSNIHQTHRQYLSLEHESRLKHNPTSTKLKVEEKLKELHVLVDFMGENLMMSRLIANV